MPWSIVESDDRCPVSRPFGVVKDDDNALEGCHATMEDAEEQQAALYAVEEEGKRMVSGWLDGIRGIIRQLLGTKQVEVDRAISTQQIYERLRYALNETEDGHYTYVNDIYHDAGESFAIVTREGKLYRIPILLSSGSVTFGPWVEVVANFTSLPTEQSLQGATRVIRQANGRYRWVSVSCTAIVNRDGEIDSTALFDDFVTRLQNGTAEYPIRDFFHLGEKFRIGQADFVAREGVALITSGLYDENSPLADAEIVARQTDPAAWGDSIHYQPDTPPTLWEVSEGITIPVYQSGVLRMISTLPEPMASSLFTGTTIQEVNRMRDNIFSALVALFQGDEEKAKEYAGGIDEMNRSVAEGGLIARSTADAVADVSEPAVEDVDEPEPEPTEQEDVTREIVLDEDAVDAISVRVMANMQPFLDQLKTFQEGLAQTLVTLNDQVQRTMEMDTRLQAVERTDEQKRQEWANDLPRSRSAQTVVTYRPREAHANQGDAPPTTEQIANETLGKLPQYSQQR